MSLGDFVMYLFFTGLVAAPLVQIASVGTQITEAFAGLDRIREVRSLAGEDEQDASRDALHDLCGEVAFDRVEFEYTPGVPVLKGRVVPRAGGDHHGAGGVERVGEEHADLRS